MTKSTASKKGAAPVAAPSAPAKSKFAIGSYVFIGILLLFALLSAMLFDVKASDAGDDSNYIQMAYGFLHNHTFPAYQGPLYPIILSVFIAIFGINLILLKALSGIFLLLFLIVTFRTFRNSLPLALLLCFLGFLAVNKTFIYYGSQTFSEALYLLFTALVVFFFGKYFIAGENPQQPKPFKKLAVQHLIVGSLLLACFLTRTAGIACVGAVLLYFLLYKQWKNLGFAVGAFVVAYIVFSLIKKIGWSHASAVQFSDQLKMLLQKDAYNPGKGSEDFSGLVVRFWDNSKQYLSAHFYIILGFQKPEYIPDALQKGTAVTVITYIVLAASLWSAFKSNKLIFFAGLTAVLGTLMTFVMLQVSWNQERLILVHVPYLLLLIIYAIYKGVNSAKTKIPPVVSRAAAYIVISLCIIFSLQVTQQQISDFAPERQENMAGNMLYGFTPDFQNFIQLSKWSAEHIGKDTMIACRKPSIAFIYSQRPFFGIFTIPNITEKDALNYKAPAGSTAYTVSLNAFNDPVTMSFQRAFAKYSTIEVQWNTVQRNDTVYQQNNGKLLSTATMKNPNDKSGVNRNAPIHTVIYAVPDSAKAAFTKMADDSKLTYATSPDEIFKNLHDNSREPYTYRFDDLLNNLKSNKVHYMVIASLRQNPAVKTENIISTLHRYAFMLQLKYPDLFSIVRTEGQDEQAQLIKIDYSKANY